MTDDIRAKYRADLEFATNYLRADSRSNYESAVKFAEAGIKSAFALNGGGLIALPAFIALFNVNAQLARNTIIGAGAVFVFGLIFAALTSLFGYLSAMIGHESIENTIQATGTVYAAAYQQQPTSAATVQSLEQRSKALSDRSVLLRNIAVAAVVASLLCFVVGALISGCLLINLRAA
jgi:hypothetical protein